MPAPEAVVLVAGTGVMLGMSVGAVVPVGGVVGATVGLVVEADVGTTVVGTVLGATLGDFVGAVVVATVGATVDFVVGRLVGAVVASGGVLVQALAVFVAFSAAATDPAVAVGSGGFAPKLQANTGIANSRLNKSPRSRFTSLPHRRRIVLY